MRNIRRVDDIINRPARGACGATGWSAKPRQMIYERLRPPFRLLLLLRASRTIPNRVHDDARHWWLVSGLSSALSGAWRLPPSKLDEDNKSTTTTRQRRRRSCALHWSVRRRTNDKRQMVNGDATARRDRREKRPFVVLTTASDHGVYCRLKYDNNNDTLQHIASKVSISREDGSPNSVCLSIKLSLKILAFVIYCRCIKSIGMVILFFNCPFRSSLCYRCQSRH